MKNILVILTGPTAVGKTDLSVQLAKHFGCDIVSCDSRQFYKELAIGTAKPTKEEMDGVTHHFINSHHIWEDYNVSDFEIDALALLEKLFEKNPVQIMTGGSGLYIDAITKGIDILPTADDEIRSYINENFEKSGITFLQEKLKELDPEFYEEVDINNPNRLKRAIEVCLTTGKKYSELRLNEPKERPFKMIKIVINRDREELYERIDRRVDIMLEQGLLDEVKSVLEHKGANALKTVGYREFFEYFDGEIDLEEAIRLVKRNSRRYAKRQLTWFRKDEEYKWFDLNESDNILAELIKWVKN